MNDPDSSAFPLPFLCASISPSSIYFLFTASHLTADSTTPLPSILCSPHLTHHRPASLHSGRLPSPSSPIASRRNSSGASFSGSKGGGDLREIQGIGEEMVAIGKWFSVVVGFGGGAMVNCYRTNPCRLGLLVWIDETGLEVASWAFDNVDLGFLALVMLEIF
ncbi:hypothetical protein Droror1_Dr00024126 [Drosera rotundifolia]